ncbi:MAG: fibronectin type III domain-containing protein, partial [Planctomycetota bacterium]
MRKKYLLAAAAIIGGAGIFLALKRTGPAALHVTPEVLKVRTSQVTIAWLSEQSYKGRIFYKQAGSDSSPLSASESFGASDRHEVMVTGLSPSTRYAYWIENSEGRFQFQTQPLLSTPFSFMFVWGDMSRRILPLMMAESPQFVVSLTDLAK